MDDLSIDLTGKLFGTVKFYDQHLIVCSGHSDWPAIIEDEGGFIAALTEAVKSAEIPGLVRITACDAPSPGDGTDLLFYPKNVRLAGLVEADIPAVVRLLQGETDLPLKMIPLEKPVWLVCGHAQRDPRCGQCGPPIQTAIEANLQKKGKPDAIEVWRSSHLGGHRFAGVVVCYPSGDWYGRITADDVPMLIDAELRVKQPWLDRWRGRMGVTGDEACDGVG